LDFGEGKDTKKKNKRARNTNGIRIKKETNEQREIRGLSSFM